MENEVNLHDLLTDIKAYLGPFPVIEPLPDGSVPDVSFVHIIKTNNVVMKIIS